MHILVKVIAACMVGVLLMSCAGRRAARQMERDAFMHRQGFACTAPAQGACAGCNITCAMGSPATCTPGKVAGDKCAVQPSCKCATK